MKKFYIFLIGGLIGAIVALVICIVCSSSYEDNIKFYSQPGRSLRITSFEVIHTLPLGGAVAYAQYESGFVCKDSIVLLMNKEDVSFFDDQIVDVPHNKCVKQIGIYRHDKHNGVIKNIPIVDIYCR